jgi:hypothetical protein
MKLATPKAVACAMALSAFVASSTTNAQPSVTPAEARAIAKEAYIYGFPMVDNYRIEYLPPAAPGRKATAKK